MVTRNTQTYMEQKVLTSREKAMFAVIRDYTETLMKELPNASCHQLCQRLSTFLPKYLKWEQGYFGGTHQHSWLRFIEQSIRSMKQSQLRDRFIIDVYPVASVGGPLLVDTGTHLIIPTPWNDLYKIADLTDALPDNQKDQLAPQEQCHCSRTRTEHAKWDNVDHPFDTETDPLLNGTQPCGACGVAGKIFFDPGDGYTCEACGRSD